MNPGELRLSKLPEAFRETVKAATPTTRSRVRIAVDRLHHGVNSRPRMLIPLRAAIAPNESFFRSKVTPATSAA
ncbi:MAG: hypothetical protein ACJ8EL_14015 [Rhizomicrobium sp.]